MPRSDVMSSPPREVFEAGFGRKLAFSLVVLLLAPFFVSLFPMIFYRVQLGHWNGMFGLLVLAAGLTILMLLALIELMLSLRARVAFGEKAVRIRLPRGRGIFPSLRFSDRTIPYEDISAVEIRREVYGGTFAPVMLKGARVVLKDGGTVQLGYVNEANVDPCLPFDEIAAKIAARVHVELHDLGHVHRSATRKMLTMAATGGQRIPLDDAEVDRLNARHDRLMLAFVAVLVLLVGASIFSDRDQRFPWSNPTVDGQTAEASDR